MAAERAAATLREAIAATREGREVRAVLGRLALLLPYTWVDLVLARFPYTRVGGTNLRNPLVDLVVGVGTHIVEAVPGLVTVTVSFFLTRFLAGLLDSFFDRARQSPQRPRGAGDRRGRPDPAHTPRRSKACRC